MINPSSRSQSFRLLGFALGASLLSPSAVAAEPKPVPATKKAVAQQVTFSTAQQAVDALVSAAERFDVPALLAILGPGSKDLLESGEPVKDRETATAFALQAREKATIAVDPKTPSRAILSVGKEDWPLPIPIIQKGGAWRFDAKAGKQEILFRRIGQNELDAIHICRGYVEAQHQYALTWREGYALNQYAQRIISTPGKQDGLAWQSPDGTWAGPIGEAIARAIEQGYPSKGSPYHGYYFKILKGQGPAAPLGQLDFVVKGVMIGGFALAATPAEYGKTGIKTFIVSHDGVVFEKDFGKDTPKAFKAMVRFNPDRTWTPVLED